METQGSASYRFFRMVVLMGGAILAGMVQLAILPAMPAIGAHFAGDGHDGTLIGQYVTTISALSMAVGGPLAGIAAGRFGKRRVLVISALAYGITGGIGAYAPDLWTLLLSRLLLGVAASGYVTVGVALLGDYYPDPVQRDRLIGWFTVIGGGGSVAVLQAASWLTEQGGWNGPFSLYLSGIPLFLIALFTIAEPRRAVVQAVAGGQWAPVARAWGIYVMLILVSISMYTVTIQGTFLMKDEGLAGNIANVMLMTSVGTVVGAYSFRFVRPALGFSLTLALTWGLLALGNAGFASTSSVWLLAACAGLVGIASGFNTPLMTSAVMGAVPPSAAANAVGVSMGCLFLGQFLHPPALTPFREAFGLHGAILWMGGLSLMFAVLSALWSLRGRQRAVA